MARSRVTGARKLNRLLRKLPEDIRGGVETAVRAAADAVLQDAIAAVPAPGSNPYATGDLKRKLRVQVSRNGLVARVGSWGRRRARHIHLVEFGVSAHDIEMPDGGVIRHPGAPAQPFLFPAHARNRASNARLIRSAVVSALQKAAGGFGGFGDE